MPTHHRPPAAPTSPAGPLRLQDLLALDGAEFVRAAYRAVLQRDPDPQGFVSSLDRLALGTDRLQWLRELRASPEGQLRQALIDGLDEPGATPSGGADALQALLRRDGADFVQHAYALLLGRPADGAGLAHYNARLTAGVSREQIVAEIGASDEFARRNRPVPGLAPLLKRHRRRQHPVARAAVGLARRLRAATGREPEAAVPADAGPPAPGRDTGAAPGEAMANTTGHAGPAAARARGPRPVLAARQALLSQPALEARDDWPPTATQAAVTIVSKNYFAFARTLARSYLQHHPDHDVIIVLVDRADGLVPLRLDNGARVIEAAALRVPDLALMACRYAIMELNTAVKPFVLDDLFERGGYQRLVYLDPDIQVFQPLTPVHQALDRASVVLTPHMRQPCWDSAMPSDTAILQSGTYNLGFIALRRGTTSQRLLAWWKTKLFRDCVVDLARGLFVDQKWIDLVPGFFPDHEIVYHPGCNAAYWNLHERRIDHDGSHWRADGQALVFFHFSGYLPYAPEVLSKHQDRHHLADLPALKALTDGYAAALMAEGYEESCRWPYAFGTLPNGVRLPLDLVARATRLAEQVDADLPCPVTEADAFCRFLMSRGVVPGQDRAVLLLHGLLALRPDVVAAFPGCQADHDHPGFRAWLASSGVREYVLQDLLAFEGPAYAPPAPPASDDAAWAGVHRILNLYFLRTDLQAEFPDMASAAGRQGWVAWLRAHRAALRLADADITQFEAWSPRAATLLAQAAFLYRHDGRPRSLQPGSAALAARRRQVHSPLSEADLATWLAGTPALAVATPGGINLAGFLDAPSGVGESARSLRNGLAQTGRVVQSVTLPHAQAQSQQAGEPVSPLLFGWPGAGAAVSISVANADSVALLRSFLPPGFWAARNVGYWVWETDTLPAAMGRAQQGFDEIWTPSHHSARAIERSVACPVHVLPHALDLAGIDAARADRAAFGLPEDGLVIGFAFDPHSMVERKNVAGLVEAFEAAFRKDDNCWLVLKVNHTGHRSYALQDALSRVRSSRVLVAQQVLGRGETFSFIRSLDAYASLHRAEGFGLTCAEAMACGLPVVASGYSGNLDFMTPHNSLLVPTTVVQTDRPHGPYPAGTRWGQPDAEAAVAALRSLLSADLRRQLGQRASDSVRQALSPAAVGRQLQALLGSPSAVPAAAAHPLA